MVYISMVWGGLAQSISLIRLCTIILVSGLSRGALFFRFIKFVSFSRYVCRYISCCFKAAFFIFSCISGWCSCKPLSISVVMTHSEPTLDSHIILAPYYDPWIISEHPKLLPVSMFASLILKSRFTPRLPTKFWVNLFVVVVFITSRFLSKSVFYLSI